MHRNCYLIDMCIVEGCTVLDDTCTECGTPADALAAAWPSLDDAIPATCDHCADMSRRLVWEDGVAVERDCDCGGDG